jgi:putative ABC transport system ATP-binding protein
VSDSTILEITKLEKYLPGEQRSCLFTDVSAKITQPCIVAILGASGEGKSTLLRIIGKLDVADQGTIRYRDKLSTEWRPQEWRKRVCYVAQHAVMLPGTVDDNLRAASNLHRRPFDDKLASDLMSAVGLNVLDLGKRASDLSGGEQQRVALVRSLLLRPEVLLLDEVTASLDLHSKMAVGQLLQQWQRREGAAMIWVTHDLEQARDTSDQVWFMAEHTLLEQSETEAFFVLPKSEAARSFLRLPAAERV